MDSDPTKFSPPYNVPWATFISIAERIAADPPTRVDRSYLGSQSGTVQTYVIAALKGFHLIDEAEARPTGILDWADPAKRKTHVAELLNTYYGQMVELGRRNSTAGELSDAFAEAFPHITGDSRTKAIRFFLAAMAYAELPVAPLWAKVKAPRGASVRRTATRKPRNGEAAAEAGASSQVKTAHSQTVQLPSGGTVTLSVDVNPLTLKGKERAWFYEVVDKLDEYASGDEDDDGNE